MVQKLNFTSFDEYHSIVNSIWKTSLDREDFRKSRCTCPFYFERFLCKHIIGIAAVSKLYSIPNHGVLAIYRHDRTPWFGCFPCSPRYLSSFLSACWLYFRRASLSSRRMHHIYLVSLSSSSSTPTMSGSSLGTFAAASHAFSTLALCTFCVTVAISLVIAVPWATQDVHESWLHKCPGSFNLAIIS